MSEYKYAKENMSLYDAVRKTPDEAKKTIGGGDSMSMEIGTIELTKEEANDLFLLAPDSFTITDDRKADWAIECILKEEAERDRLIELANEKIKELNERKAAIAEKCEMDNSYLKMLLRQYFETVPKNATKTQESYKLLSGKLVLKRQAPEFVRDDKVMTEWAKASAPSFIKVVESVNWADLKKQTTVKGEAVVFTETGEVVPGVVAKAREDVFEVTK